ncbi:PREDICTED: N-myc-interactor [Tinamus guttatus]|uniref:N-myc-interactor n=1 Tax=Tinamus guttatus TaxID=94827 RepID=UPI00052F045B|nr:PREDICTED: N-myc-interactor [Tinamus guttatus]
MAGAPKMADTSKMAGPLVAGTSTLRECMWVFQLLRLPHLQRSVLSGSGPRCRSRGSAPGPRELSRASRRRESETESRARRHSARLTPVYVCFSPRCKPSFLLNGKGLEDNHPKQIMETTDPSGPSTDELESLKKELEKWKERLEQLEKAKGDLLCKFNADEERVKARNEMMTKLAYLREKQNRERPITWESYETELSLINKENAELKREIEKLKEDLSNCDSVRLWDGQIKKKVPETKMKFTEMKEMKDDYPDTDTHCVFHVNTKIPFKLKKNEALLTFEEEEVAQRLTKMRKHTVNLDSQTTDMRVEPFALGTGIKFELHVTISGKTINVSEIPEQSIPDDWVRDKLELHFCKPERGGGEIEHVEYDKTSRRAVITFLRPEGTSCKVFLAILLQAILAISSPSFYVNSTAGYPASGLVRRMECPFFANGKTYLVCVSPSMVKHLEKLQIYSGISKKTILLKGIQKTDDEEDSVQDMIEIHFQKPSNGGGEIVNIKYVSKGVTWACFEEDA